VVRIELNATRDEQMPIDLFVQFRGKTKPKVLLMVMMLRPTEGKGQREIGGLYLNNVNPTDVRLCALVKQQMHRRLHSRECGVGYPYLPCQQC